MEDAEEDHGETLLPHAVSEAEPLAVPQIVQVEESTFVSSTEIAVESELDVITTAQVEKVTVVEKTKIDDDDLFGDNLEDENILLETVLPSIEQSDVTIEPTPQKETIPPLREQTPSPPK